jgi:hypothetical protein
MGTSGNLFFIKVELRLRDWKRTVFDSACETQTYLYAEGDRWNFIWHRLKPMLPTSLRR